MIRNLAIHLLIILCFSQTAVFGDNLIKQVSESGESQSSVSVLDQYYYPGTSVGLYDNYIAVVGGEIKEDQSYSNEIHLFERIHESLNEVADYTLSFGLSSPSVIADDSYFYVLGGNTQNGVNKKVFRFKIAENTIVPEELPPLPVDTILTNATFFENKLWIGGTRGSRSGYWTYDTGDTGSDTKQTWQFKINEEFTGPAKITSQSDTNERKLIQFSFDTVNNQYDISYLYQESFETVQSFNLKNRLLTDIYPAGFSSILLLFNAEEYSEITKVLQFNTLTQRISTVDLPFGNINPIEIKKSGDEFVLINKDNGNYNAAFYSISYGTGLKSADIIILIFYFVLLIGMGYFFSKRNKSIDDYFRGGKRTPGWAAGLSIVATTLSAVSYMSLPGVSFSSNLTYIFMPLGNIVALVFVIYWVLPFYIRLNITSAYEYLDLRYDSKVRLVGSLIYITGVLFRIGIIILLPAIIISVVTGMNIFLCIILMGIISTIYTTLGGIEAVIWSDVLQVLVLIIGILFGIVTILYQLNFDFSYVFETASSFEKLKFADTDFDLSKVTVWVLILYSFGRINVFLSNQAIIQRLVSASSEREAAKSMVYNAVIGIPLFVLLLVFGVLLFVFFHSFPESLSPFLSSQDEIVPTFVINELPTGLSGILIAAIFAAAMSTLDSTINSTSTVITKDLYIKYNWKLFGWNSFTFAKYMTGFLGCLGTLIALQLATFEIGSIFDVFIEIIGIFGGGLAGVFLLGIITTRGNSMGALIGLTISGLIIFLIKSYTNLHFFLFAIIGLSSSYLFGYVCSVLFRPNAKNLNGLTIFTLNNENKRI